MGLPRTAPQRTALGVVTTLLARLTDCGRGPDEALREPLRACAVTLGHRAIALRLRTVG